jgi:hypothetical protein
MFLGDKLRFITEPDNNVGEAIVADFQPVI